MRYDENLERINRENNDAVIELFKRYCLGEITLEEAAQQFPQISEEMAEAILNYESQKTEFIEEIRSIYRQQFPEK